MKGDEDVGAFSTLMTSAPRSASNRAAYGTQIPSSKFDHTEIRDVDVASNHQLDVSWVTG